MIYARRDNTVVNFRKLPMSYYSEAVSEKKTDLVSYIDGKGGFSKRLKAYPLCYLEEEARSAPDPVLFKVRFVIKNTIKKSESPLVEKIAVGEGEIELRIEGGQLYAFSRNKSGTTTYEVSKKLAQGITPEEALRNAEEGVLTTLETRNRQKETNLGIGRYFREEADKSARKRLEEMRKEREIYETARKSAGKRLVEDLKQEKPVILEILKQNPDFDKEIAKAYLTQEIWGVAV